MLRHKTSHINLQTDVRAETYDLATAKRLKDLNSEETAQNLHGENFKVQPKS